MDRQQVLNELILGYRKILEERYQYNNIKVKYDLPSSFDKNRVELFRKFFLEYIYPHPETRTELNDAFNSLDGYIKNPEKLLRILMDSATLLFKHGRHLPKILKAGMNALKSFRTATQFENRLVKKAMELEMAPPYSTQQIYQLFGALTPAELDEFIKNSQTLFENLHDRALVQKTKVIVTHLADKMKKRPSLYANAEINGLEIGKEIITKGDQLFAQLSVEEQQQIIKTVIQIERDALKYIYSKTS